MSSISPSSGWQAMMDTLSSLVRSTVETYLVPYSTQLKNAWFGFAVASCGILGSGLLTASYGRHHSENRFIPTVNGKLAWTSMEIASPLTMLVFYHSFKTPGPFLSTGQVLVGLWLVHYFNRS